MTMWIAPGCPAWVEQHIRRQAAERGEQVMPSRQAVPKNRQALTKNGQRCPSVGNLPVFQPLATDQRTTAERAWKARTIAGKPQLPCDHGLFSDDRHQLDLVEMFMDPTNEP